METYCRSNVECAEDDLIAAYDMVYKELCATAPMYSFIRNKGRAYRFMKKAESAILAGDVTPPKGSHRYLANPWQLAAIRVIYE